MQLLFSGLLLSSQGRIANVLSVGVALVSSHTVKLSIQDPNSISLSLMQTHSDSTQ